MLSNLMEMQLCKLLRSTQTWGRLNIDLHCPRPQRLSNWSGKSHRSDVHKENHPDLQRLEDQIFINHSCVY